MRDGMFEVLLISEGKPLDTVEIQGQLYVCAVPGREYSVKVNIYPLHTGAFAFKYLRLGLFIDGVDVNYWKRVDFTTLNASRTEDEPIAVFFYGFSKSQTEMTSFVFSQLSSTSTSSYSLSGNNDTSSLGNIRLVVYEAEVTYGTHANISRGVTVAEGSVKEDTKLWHRPSVATTAGKALTGKETFQPLEKWANKSNTPIKSMTLKYHTIEMLTVLEELSKNVNFREDVSKKRKFDDAGTRGEIDSTFDNVPTQDYTLGNSSDQTQYTRLNPDIVCIPVVKEIPLLDLSSLGDDDSIDGLQWSTVKKTMI